MDIDEEDVIVGVDNGLNGGLVAISRYTGGVIAKTVMPILVRGKKKEIDIYKVYQWVLGLDSRFIFAVEEPLHHAKSSQAVRSMGISFGNLLAPDECWLKNKRCSKPHDGMVDAFLIAQYIRKGYKILDGRI